MLQPPKPLNSPTIRAEIRARVMAVGDAIFGPVERCTQCSREIEMMAFKRTGVCCELCRKKRDGELILEFQGRG